MLLGGHMGGLSGGKSFSEICVQSVWLHMIQQRKPVVSSGNAAPSQQKQ